jgi:exodeoxyribonuclease VII large subunit
MDLLDEPSPTDNAPEFTVSEISGAVKRALEDQFGRVRVRGEVGRVTRPRSGHVYLDLKDDRAVLASVIWKGQAARLDIQPAEGDEVIAEGKLTTFAGQSRYQLVIDRLAYAGEGALLAKLEKLKRALAAEGLFAEERKRPLPYLPRVVGVVTSPSGAVIRDILHRLAERFPMPVLVWPVAVQGAACAGEVAAAVRGFNALAPDGPIPRPDVLIVARGGGSVEDLWGFNEEVVVRAVADSAIPVISAVGHETDTTLIDFAADRRAPTPTAAAEIAAPVRADLLSALAALDERRRRTLARGLENRRSALEALARIMPGPDDVLAGPRQRLDRSGEALPRALSGLAARRRLAFAQGRAGRFGPGLLRQPLAVRSARLSDRVGRLGPALARRAALARRETDRLGARLSPAPIRRGARRGSETLGGLARRLDRALAEARRRPAERVARAARLLESLGYKATLARGYAVVRAEGAALTRRAQVRAGAALEIEFADGRVDAIAGGDPSPKPPERKRAKSRDGGQGSLF